MIGNKDRLTEVGRLVDIIRVGHANLDRVLGGRNFGDWHCDLQSNMRPRR